MPPLPKRKYAKARQGERRSHLHLDPQAGIKCPKCHQPTLPHRVCPHCGTYKGEEVVKIEAAKKS